MMIFNHFRHLLFAYLLLFSFGTMQAQSEADSLYGILEGQWEGAFIKGNSFQKFDIQFYKKDGAMKSFQIIEDWHPQFGEFELPVEIDSLNQIRFNCGYGKAILQLDGKALELNGSIEGTVPAIYLHFKKVPNAPDADYLVDPIIIQNGDINLNGHLHQPKYGDKKTAIIIVGGRGCYAGSTRYDLYAKLLRSYGVSVVSFNKRGTGKSNGNCDQASMADLANDVSAVHDYLENHPNNYEHIGVIGSSAGGWVMAKASEKTPFAFMIGIVGPSTSVRDQQLQSMDYGLGFYKLPLASRSDLLEYTNMMFDAEPNKKNFERFEELLKASKRDGWYDLLDPTDVPESIEAIANLWVRRHRYDPGPALKQFNNPLLAIYGEKDWIVPYQENIERLKELFPDDRNALLTTVLAPNANHGTDTDDAYVDLSNDKSYWRFFRIAPHVNLSIIRFLKQHQFID